MSDFEGVKSGSRDEIMLLPFESDIAADSRLAQRISNNWGAFGFVEITLKAYGE